MSHCIVFVLLQVFVQRIGQEPDSHRAQSKSACGNTSFNFGDPDLGRPKWWFCIWVSYILLVWYSNSIVWHLVLIFFYLKCDVLRILIIYTMKCVIMWDVVLNYLASFWRRICWCSFCGLCDKRMVGKYAFNCCRL